MDPNGTSSFFSTAELVQGQQAQHDDGAWLYRALGQLTVNTEALQRFTNGIATTMDRLAAREADRMEMDTTSNDPLPAFAKGSGPRIAEPGTFDGEFNDRIRENFIKRITE
jgi:hypothetical protein